MIEFTNRHETLTRLGITIAVALAWCFFAYVVFASPPSGETVLSGLDLSKPAAAALLYKRTKAVAAAWRRGGSR